MKLLFDFLPLLIFFAAFKFYDIYTATAVAIVATLAQVSVWWLKHRRFEPLLFAIFSQTLHLARKFIAKYCQCPRAN